MVTRLRITSFWRWAVLLAGVLCAVAFASPMTARAAMTTFVHPRATTARALGATPDEIAVTGTDGALWAEGSAGWFSLGGYLVGAPAVASIPDPSGVNPGLPVFVGVGGDHRLYVRDLSHPWQVLVAGAYCLNNPAAEVVRPNAASGFELIVGCEGSDAGLWTAGEAVSYGALPGPLPGMQALGGVLGTGPALAEVNPLGAVNTGAALTFFVVGTDQHIWTRTEETGWQRMPWVCLGHPAASTSLSPTHTSQITVFACDGSDGELWMSLNTGAGWSGAQPLGGALNEGPGVAADPQGVYFDAEGTDHGVWQNGFPYGGNPFGWSSLGGATNYGAATAALLYADANP